MSTTVQVAETTDVTVSSLLHDLEEGLDKYAEAVALCAGRDVTHYELDEFSTLFSAFLQQSSLLVPGSFLAIDGLQSPAGIVAFYGAVRAGLKILILQDGECLQSTSRLIAHNVRAVICSHRLESERSLFSGAKIITLPVDSGADAWALRINDKDCAQSFDRSLTKVDPGFLSRPTLQYQQQAEVLWYNDSGQLECYISGQSLSLMPTALRAMVTNLLKGDSLSL